MENREQNLLENNQINRQQQEELVLSPPTVETLSPVEKLAITEEKNKEELKAIMECLLFVSSHPLTIDKIKEVLENIDKRKIKEIMEELKQDYARRQSGLQIMEIAQGWQITTKQEYAFWLNKLLKTKDMFKLSNSALETLAIIAYKQPITRAEIEQIRGVDTGGIMHNLLEKRLIRITGRKDCLGHPLLYGTTTEFLQYFGLASLADLPLLEDLHIR